MQSRYARGSFFHICASFCNQRLGELGPVVHKDKRGVGGDLAPVQGRVLAIHRSYTFRQPRESRRR